MSKKYVIIGAGLTGTLLALEIRKRNKKAEIYVYDEEEISFLHYLNEDYENYLSQKVEKNTNLIFYNPEYFKNKYDINAKLNTRLYDIFEKEQEVLLKTNLSGQEIKQKYDYLIICNELQNNVPFNLASHSVYKVKNSEEIKIVNDLLTKNNVKDIVISHCGFLELQAAKILSLANKNVTLIQPNEQILDAFDYDMVQMVNKDLYDHNVSLILNEISSQISENRIKLGVSEKEIKFQAIVYTHKTINRPMPEYDFSILWGGKKQNKNKKIKLNRLNEIIVDKNCKTNFKNVYAIGNCIRQPNSLIVSLRTELQVDTIKKQIDNLLNHIFKKQTNYNNPITQTTHLELFDLNIACTGLKEKDCKLLNIDYKTAFVIPTNNSDEVSKQKPIHFKLIFHSSTKRIVGAQAISKVDVKSKVDVITKMINNNATLDDLKKYCSENKLENDVLGIVAKVALNVSDNQFNQIEHIWVRDLVKTNQFILDIRSKEAYNKAHIINAINIPLDELEQRHNEIPNNKPVYIHCRTGRSSYKAVKMLEKLGFDNLINIQGSFLQLSYYEYFNDKTTNREKILTDYNFE